MLLPVAAVVTLAPGAATALVVRHATLNGRRTASHARLGDVIGVLVWALLAADGVAAVVAASTQPFTVVKLAGAMLLLSLGVQAIREGRASAVVPRVLCPGSALRQGLLTSLSDPKLAVPEFWCWRRAGAR